MKLASILAVTSLSLLAAGCASGGAKTDEAAEATPVRGWVGSLQPTQQRTGQVAVTGQSRAFGSVTIGLPSGNGAMSRMKVHITLSIPTASSTQLRWAILPDRCGSGDLPVIGFEQFPLLDIGNNGRGEVTSELPLDLTPNNTYHVNVYQGGQQLDNVVTCGNVKYDVR